MPVSDLDRILARINYDPKALLGAEESVKPDPIPWPTGLAPVPVKHAAAEPDPLPKADVLIVTYTTAEGQALADTLSPGVESSEWTKYRNGWPELKKLIEGDRAPSLESDCAGIWTLTQIGDKRVVLVKSDLHPSTDGPKLPMVNLWRQMIVQVDPDLVITTGTAGGVGAATALGDVIVAANVKWNCQKQFKNKPWAHDTYSCAADLTPHPDVAELIQVNAHHFAPEGTWPHIARGDIETTDFFAFDTADDHYGLRAYDTADAAVEMDDAALGLAVVGTSQKWVSVRNASDPGNLAGASLEAEDKLAEQIYEKYGYWTTVGSAITCWALVAGLN